jgi:hypothetical protein
MQNAVTVVCAIAGIFAGGWLAVALFSQSGAADLGVTALMGAIPGTFVGGWIGFKLSAGRA